MGGPRAWKKMQQKQQDFQNSWVEEDQNDIDADGDSDASKKNIQKTDLYAEYGIDPETEIEKSQRETGVGDTGELPGQEDVRFNISFHCGYCLLSLGIHYGNDVTDFERRSRYRWL